MTELSSALKDSGLDPVERENLTGGADPGLVRIRVLSGAGDEDAGMRKVIDTYSELFQRSLHPGQHLRILPAFDPVRHFPCSSFFG